MSRKNILSFPELLFCFLNGRGINGDGIGYFVRDAHGYGIGHDLHLAVKACYRYEECGISFCIYRLVFLVSCKHIIIIGAAPDNLNRCFMIFYCEKCRGFDGGLSGSSIKNNLCRIAAILQIQILR